MSVCVCSIVFTNAFPDRDGDRAAEGKGETEREEGLERARADSHDKMRHESC